PDRAVCEGNKPRGIADRADVRIRLRRERSSACDEAEVRVEPKKCLSVRSHEPEHSAPNRESSDRSDRIRVDKPERVPIDLKQHPRPPQVPDPAAASPQLAPVRRGPRQFGVKLSRAAIDERDRGAAASRAPAEPPLRSTATSTALAAIA